jgi:hypothetical protein
MTGIVFERPPVADPTDQAVVTVRDDDRTPVEQAWADLCDEKENAEVERVMASIGGWEAWAETPLTLLAFTGAFNGDPAAAMRARERAAAKAGAL